MDPGSGDVVRVPDRGALGATIAWLADGSGFFVVTNATTDADGTIRPGGSKVIRLDGSRSVLTSAEPDLSSARPTLGPDGALLAICGRRSLQPICRGERRLTRQLGDGTQESWLTSLPPKRRLSGAIFAHDGSILVLVDDVSSGRLLRVERLVRPDTMLDVASVGATPGTDVVTIVGRAADGSLVALDASRDGSVEETIVVPTDGRPGTYHHGVSLGFLRSDVADAIPGGSFETTADAIAPTTGAAPRVRSEAEVSAQVTSGIILGTAADPGDPTGQPTTRDLGPLTFANGAGAFISCVGLGTVDVEFAGGGVDADCFLGTIVGGSGEDRLTVPVKVVADQGAAWQVVIYDAVSPGTSQ